MVTKPTQQKVIVDNLDALLDILPPRIQQPLHQQEGISEVTGAVIRESLVRLDSVPLVVKAIALPDCAPGTRVKLTLRDMDLLTLELNCPFLGLASE